MNNFYWLIQLVSKGIFLLFYRHRVYGVENIPKGAAIIAPNHASYFDPPIIAASCPVEVAFLAKKSLFDLPLLNKIIRSLNAYPVKGGAENLSSIKLICKLLKGGEKVVIFPEGKRTEDRQLREIKPGIGMLALRSNAPIVPVYIEGAYDVWPIQRRFPKLFGKISCTFGPPICTEKYRSLPRREAQKAIAKDLSVAIAKLKSDTLSAA